VARDRKRAKQRRQRGSSGSGRGAKAAEAVTPSQPVRADLPGSLDHASGEADEFDAALVSGAGGVPAAPGRDDIESDQHHLSETEIEEEAAAEGDISEDELQELEAGGGGTGAGGGGRGGGGGDGDDGGVSPERASGAPLRGGNRVIGFLRASWAELQRVQWPDRRAVTQATAVVLGFVAVAGAYLGLADFVAKEIVEFIL
jgi:preprotein translocase subunit SecE